MEARQRVKLSLTNRSSGLIPTARVMRSGKPAQQASVEDASHILITYLEAPGRLVDLVVIARGPHPIPSRTRP